MKPKPGHILCLLGMLFVLGYAVQAQEAYPLESSGGERDGSYTPVDGETRSHLRLSETPAEEYADADTSAYAPPVVAGREQSQTRSAAREDASQPGNQESVLGFNFLYYIIQKFKMSDIVEK